VAGSCERGDEPSGCDATDLLIFNTYLHDVSRVGSAPIFRYLVAIY
jgi:hypothetical protein